MLCIRGVGALVIRGAGVLSSWPLICSALIAIRDQRSRASSLRASNELSSASRVLQHLEL